MRTPNKQTFIVLFWSALIISGFNRVNAQDNTDSLKSVLNSDYIAEQLVALAWKNSGLRKGNTFEQSMLEADLKANKLSLLEGFAVGGNMNEFTISPPENQVVFYPRYNISYRLSYGQITETATEKKKTKLMMQSLDAKNESDRLKFKAEVLRNFQLFQLTEELLLIAKEKLVSINSELKIVEQEFSEGLTELADYNRYLENHRQAKAEEAKAQHDHVIARINLEEIIGMSYDDALKAIKQ